MKNENKITSGQTLAEPAEFCQPEEFDKKLIYFLNKKKIPSLKQSKYILTVLPPKQRLTLIGLIALAGLCLVAIGLNFYLRNFLPAPISGGEYTEGLFGAPQYVNPLLCQTNDVDSDISRLVFSGLLKYDKDLILAPDLAGSWEESADKKTYTFTLKENLKWHDGQSLTADDVIFTFKSIKDPDFRSPLIVSLRGVEIEKIDGKTVKFILPEPYPAFLEVLTFGLIPEHIWGEIPAANANLTEYNLKPIGSGPWKFKTITKDKLGNIKSYALAPNPDYLGPKPYLEKITFKFYPDFETALTAIKNHSVDGLSFLPKEFKTDLNGQKNLKYYSFSLPQYTAVFFNQKQNGFLKEKMVRQALALSIDKIKILNEALQGEGEIIDGPILPLPIEISADKKINFDLAKASQLLDDAGWKKITPADYQANLAKQKEETDKAKAKEAETNTTTPTTTQDLTAGQEPPAEQTDQSIYRQKENQILELTLTTVNLPENAKTAKLLKELWQNIGVKVNVQLIDGNKISREIIKPRNYEALLFGIIVGSNPDPYPFWHSSQAEDPGLNLALLANREVDKLLEKAKKSVSEEEQRQSFARFQEILTAEIPAIFLYNPTYTYVLDEKIKGLSVNRITIPADRFNNLEDWYIKTQRRYRGVID